MYDLLQRQPTHKRVLIASKPPQGGQPAAATRSSDQTQQRALIHNIALAGDKQGALIPRFASCPASARNTTSTGCTACLHLHTLTSAEVVLQRLTPAFCALQIVDGLPKRVTKALSREGSAFNSREVSRGIVRAFDDVRLATTLDMELLMSEKAELAGQVHTLSMQKLEQHRVRLDGGMRSAG